MQVSVSVICSKALEGGVEKCVLPPPPPKKNKNLGHGGSHWAKILHFSPLLKTIPEKVFTLNHVTGGGERVDRSALYPRCRCRRRKAKSQSVRRHNVARAKQGIPIPFRSQLFVRGSRPNLIRLKLPLSHPFQVFSTLLSFSHPILPPSFTFLSPYRQTP